MAKVNYVEQMKQNLLDMEQFDKDLIVELDKAIDTVSKLSVNDLTKDTDNRQLKAYKNGKTKRFNTLTARYIRDLKLIASTEDEAEIETEEIEVIK